LQRGDVVIALNSAPTDRMTHVNFVASLSCGLKVVLLIARDSGDDELNATDTTDTDKDTPGLYGAGLRRSLSGHRWHTVLEQQYNEVRMLRKSRVVMKW
jgi:hypothetical protein